jgi:protein arginine kinase activator
MCQECKQRAASVHITKVMNNKKEKMQLCEECAMKYQSEWAFGLEPFSIHKFLAALMEYEQGVEDRTELGAGRLGKCEVCGMTYHQFQQVGKMGCDACYRFFTPMLQPLLRKVHGGIDHLGKVPQRIGGKIRQKQELTRLRQELQQHINREEYEVAAKVRDRIRELERELNND